MCSSLSRVEWYNRRGKLFLTIPACASYNIVYHFLLISVQDLSVYRFDSIKSAPRTVLDFKKTFVLHIRCECNVVFGISSEIRSSALLYYISFWTRSTAAAPNLFIPRSHRRFLYRPPFVIDKHVYGLLPFLSYFNTTFSSFFKFQLVLWCKLITLHMFKLLP